MSEHHAKVTWKRTTPDFAYETYDRTHTVVYGGGSLISASAAPEFAGKKELTNPEEMLAAALSSCHMLTFLAVAAKSRLIVDSYIDNAVAKLDKNANGKMAVTHIRLNPKVTWGGEAPSPDKIKSLHEKAHANCFIANSLACQMTIDPA